MSMSKPGIRVTRTIRCEQTERLCRSADPAPHGKKAITERRLINRLGGLYRLHSGFACGFPIVSFLLSCTHAFSYRNSL